LNNNYSSQTSLSDATEYDSAHSRLSSVDSLLVGDNNASFGSQNQVELPVGSSPGSVGHDDEEDDDVWMNRFGKEPLKKTRSTSATEIVPISAATFGMPTKKKKISSHSRLETTTYSFSIGNNANTGDQQPVEEDGTPVSVVTGNPNVNIEVEPSTWVKRDSKERQPVRKHLKAVNVKATINVSPEQMSPKGSPQSNHKTLDESNTRSLDSGIDDLLYNSPDNRHSSSPASPMPLSESDKPAVVDSPLKLNINAARNLQGIQENDTQLRSPTRLGPGVLPKPKKPLDKKSWTADLIKSKTQKIPEQPQPGSLNERLLQQGRRNTATEEDSPVSALQRQHDNNAALPRTQSLGSGTQQSVRDIRNRFQNALDEGPQHAHTISSSGEKYV